MCEDNNTISKISQFCFDDSTPPGTMPSKPKISPRPSPFNTVEKDTPLVILLHHSTALNLPKLYPPLEQEHSSPHTPQLCLLLFPRNITEWSVY
mmetsp:Transcript_5183/g.11408  ORF Transcript_5183/g.11408 Transcript_5183/m.11408 type:complete len:94 (-) Transcript_5183:200-481(-)